MLLAIGLPLLCAAVLRVEPAFAFQQPVAQQKTVTPPATQPPSAATSHPDEDVDQYIKDQRSHANQSPATQTFVTEGTPAPHPPELLPALTPIIRVEPEYPRLAQQTGARGIVEMIATIAPDGRVAQVKVVRGHPMLQNAASSAVLQWIYAPQPVEIQTRAVTSFPPGDSLPSDGGGSRPAILIYRKEPVYPEEARQNEIKGTVELAITIGTDGRVTAARPLRGHPLLARAAGEAVLQWRYRPATVDGTAVEVESQVLLKFIGDRADR